RYSLARSSTHSVLTLDLEVITRQARENPVYYVQYVAARTASVSRNAAEVGLTRGDEFDPPLLTHDKELELLKALGAFPRVGDVPPRTSARGGRNCGRGECPAARPGR